MECDVTALFAQQKLLILYFIIGKFSFDERDTDINRVKDLLLPSKNLRI